MSWCWLQRMGVGCGWRSFGCLVVVVVVGGGEQTGSGGRVEKKGPGRQQARPFESVVLFSFALQGSASVVQCCVPLCE